ncbi:hypothetical protein ACFB49_46820 [Sphingomonas sp. DBB INV C78]|uniref:hypothetical protein n=1 Tax=Sphingomonas sp. DBB INV C78 TaxID=3349434 RepID=UPI0036D439E4
MPDNFKKLPDYLRRELELRLWGEFNPSAPYAVIVAQAAKADIDIEASLNVGPTPHEVMDYIALSEEDGERLVGAIEFEMNVEALGCSAVQQMRAVYLVTLLSEDQRAKGDDDCLFGCAFIDFEILLWEHPEVADDDGRAMRMSSPRWCALHMLQRGAIPEAIRIQAEKLIAAEVMARSNRDQSNA